MDAPRSEVSNSRSNLRSSLKRSTEAGRNLRKSQEALHPSDRLHYAVKQGNCALAHTLLAEGESPNALDCHHNSPVYYACLCGRPLILTLLLRSGGELDLLTPAGQRCYLGALTLEIRRIIKEHNISKYGVRKLGLKEVAQNPKSVRKLLEPLCKAAILGDLETIESHAKALPIIINRPATNGFTLLEFAYCGGHSNIIEYLKNHGPYSTLSIHLYSTIQPYKCNMSITPQTQIIDRNVQVTKLSPLNSAFTTEVELGIKPDITFLFQKEDLVLELRAHRVVLASRLPTLKHMWSSKRNAILPMHPASKSPELFEELKKGNYDHSAKREIYWEPITKNIEKYSYDTISMLVDYAYMGHCTYTDERTINSLNNLAKKYSIRDIQTVCDHLLTTQQAEIRRQQALKGKKAKITSITAKDWINGLSLDTLPLKTPGMAFRHLVNNPRCSDIILKVEDRLVFAHTLFLVRSEYFRTLLFGTMKVTTPVVPLSDMSYITLLHLLEYIYTDSIAHFGKKRLDNKKKNNKKKRTKFASAIPKENQSGSPANELDRKLSVEEQGDLAVALIVLANQYILPQLLEICEVWLLQNQKRGKANLFEVDTVYDLYQFADVHMALRLKKACMQFMISRFGFVERSESWDLMPEELREQITTEAFKRDPGKIARETRELQALYGTTGSNHVVPTNTIKE